MLMAQQELSMKITNAKGEQTELLGWGKGFLSSQTCEKIEGKEICKTVTPGTAIESSLNDALAAPGRRIEVADEMNEIFAALFNQLVTQAFSGAGGLLGLTGSGGSSPTNGYYEALNAETRDLNSSGTNLGDIIEDAIDTETQYKTLVQQMITSLNNAARYKADTYPGDSCHSGTLPEELQDRLDSELTTLAETNTNIALLTDLLNQYYAADFDPVLEQQIAQAFMDLQSGAELHTDADNSVLTAFIIPELRNDISLFTTQIDSVCPTDSDSPPGDIPPSPSDGA
jgi:hypothetical protein